jgi:regulator of RNase E activity RraA
MDKLISYLQTIDTPTLSNAIELLDVRPRSENFAPYSLRCLYPELGSMVGYAVTVQMESMTRMEPRDERQTIAFYEAIDASPKPAVVVMQEIGSRPEFASHSGEVMTTLMKNFGAIGLVTDGSVRDFNEVRQLGFHNFARGTVTSHAYCRIVRVGCPLQIYGMTVRPGDLLHGDINGLIEIPAERREELPEMIARVRKEEGDLMGQVRAGGFTIESLRRTVTGYR